MNRPQVNNVSVTVRYQEAGGVCREVLSFSRHIAMIHSTLRDDTKPETAVMKMSRSVERHTSFKLIYCKFLHTTCRLAYIIPQYLIYFYKLFLVYYSTKQCCKVDSNI